MKTIHLTNWWHEKSGGIGTFYRALLDAAERNGHEMVLVVPGAESKREQLGRFTRLITVRAPLVGKQNYRLIMPTKYLLSSGDLPRILEEEKPDLVEVCDKYTLNYMGGLIRERRLLGFKHRPVVVGISCERMDENFATYVGKGALGRRFTEWYMKWLYFPMFDHHITVSEHTAEELHRSGIGHKVSRGVWIRPMGVDLAQFSGVQPDDQTRRSMLELAGGDSSTVLLFYAGRLAPEKNLQLLAATLGELTASGDRDYRLLCVGEGAAETELREVCERVAPGRLAVHPFITDRGMLARMLASSDVFVHPNPSEPFGIAPLEAMAAGLPLVAPTTGGVRQYANSDNAWVSEPNGASYANAVRNIVSDPVERARRVTNARACAQRFDWPEVAAGFLVLYEEIVARFRGIERPYTIEPAFYSTRGNWLGVEV